jgi:hypothetical protein
MFQQRILILTTEIDVIRICLSAFLLTVLGINIEDTCGKYLPSGNIYFPDLKTTFSNGDVISLTSDVAFDGENYKMLYINIEDSKLHDIFCWYVTGSFPLSHVLYHRKNSVASKDCFIYYHQNSVMFTHYKDKMDEEVDMVNFLNEKRIKLSRKYYQKWRDYIDK